MDTSEDLSFLELPEPAGYQEVLQTLQANLCQPEEPTSGTQQGIYITPTGHRIPGLQQALLTALTEEEVDPSGLELPGLQLMKLLCPDLILLKQNLAKMNKPESQNQETQTCPEPQNLAEDFVQLQVSQDESKQFNREEKTFQSQNSLPDKFLEEALKINGVEGRKDLLRKFGLKSARKEDRNLIQDCLNNSTKAFNSTEMRKLRTLLADPLIKVINFSNIKVGVLFKYLAQLTTQNLKKNIDKSKNHQARRNFIRKNTHQNLRLLSKFYERCRRRQIVKNMAHPTKSAK